MSWMAELIAERGGEVDFAAYMTAALYHPEHGYYASSEPRYGRAGDFLTAPTASTWYGAVLAGWWARLAATLGLLRLVDLAAGDGSFVVAVLARLAGERDVLAAVTLVEQSSAMRTRQRERLAGGTVTLDQLASPDELVAADVATVVHASELFDALPVHRVIVSAQGVRELTVRVDGDGRLSWGERAPAAAVVAYLARHGVELVAGQVAEVNLAAEPLHRRALERVGRPALAVVLDYGYPARRLYDARGRRHGSLACYHRHQLGRDPLLAPGEQDITAHVNFDDLRLAARAAGWCELGLWSLAELLVRAGIEAELTRAVGGLEAELSAAVVTARQEVKRLLDPDGMGSDLKVLVQATPDVAELVAHSLAL